MNSHVNYDIHYRHFNTFLSRLKFFKLTYQSINKKNFSFFFVKFFLLKMDLNIKVIKVELT